MLNKKINSKIIEECVRLFEKNASHEKLFDNCLENMKKINLQSFTEQDAKNVIKPFLYEWGRMGRVLGQRKYSGWENKLENLIKKYSPKLEKFRKKDLTSIELEKFEGQIRELYDQFSKVLGKTATGKVLHILCPDFFPLWDSRIAEAVSSTGEFDEKDYYNFMLKTKDLLKKYMKTFSNLAAHYGKSKLRILDEYLWLITHDPVSLFI
ncbi:MAG: hypothetical protein QXR63_04130 [Candidatus Bathyarchaeia archaeon]